MANTIERLMGWVALAALIIAVAALALTYTPGGSEVLGRLSAALPHATDSATIDDAQGALDAGDVAEANRIATRAVAANSADANVDNHAGNIAERASDDKAAEHDYQLGEAADARNPWNYVALGQLYARQERYSQADTQLRAALTIAPNAQFLHYDLGVVELHEHLSDSALADFDTELKRTPGYQPALDGRVQALEALGRPKEAREAQILALGKLGAARPSAQPAPSPSPSPTATAAPSPTPSAMPSPTPAASPTPNVTPTALPITPVVIGSPSPASTRAGLAALASTRPKAHHTPVVAVLPSPTVTATATETPVPVPLPQSIADLASDAKGYLFEVAGEPNFGRELPFADPTEAVSVIESTMKGGKVDDILSSGTAAMLEHHFALAQSAFAVASSRAPSDWRGPYLAGINAQQRGDQAAARTFFTEAVDRGGPAAVYIGLAVADVAEGDDGSAYNAAQHAVSLSPTFTPALFTAGIVDMLLANVPAADHDLSAALANNDAPSRTSYFLQTLRAREGLQ